MGQEGVIFKGIGGFYTVRMADGTMVACKPRGIFRKTGTKPLAGDRVRLKSTDGAVVIDEILPRKNRLVRPAVANVDLVVVVASTAEPAPSTLVIDKMLAIALDQEARVALAVSKGDLAPAEPLLASYAQSGIPAFAVNAATGEGLAVLREHMRGRLSVFCGNSGVGKSTLLNALLPTANRATGEVSQALGRGRHTTREVELYLLDKSGLEVSLIADTPGFASLDLVGAAAILPENLQYAFPEIAQRMPECRFSGCTHLAEPGCAVRAALQCGEMAQSRYDSYVALYREAQQEAGRY